jgi:hypothetical protein
MNRRLQCVICVGLLGFLACCARYAYARESVRWMDLHAAYADINAESFGGTLPDAVVSWSSLDSRGETDVSNGRFSILIDLTNTSRSDVLETLRHEACHVQTVPLLNGEDVHGGMFSECMKRFHEND